MASWMWVVTASLLMPLYSLAGADQPQRLDIFVPSARFPCFRQPAILWTPTAILAFAENRNVSACAPALTSGFMPNEVGSLQLRRSLDGGITWEPLQSLYVGNIDFYTLVHDEHTGRSFLLLQAGGVKLVTSDDDGKTWSSGEEFKLTGGVPAPFNQNVQPAVGHGVQLQPNMCGDGHKCAAAGRLLVPFICVNGSAHGDKGVNLADHSCIIKSDDHGQTWSVAGFGQPGSRESQVVQTFPSEGSCGAGCVYLNARNFGKTPGHRFVARSSDGADTFGHFGQDAALVTPVTAHWTGIVGSVTRLHDTPDKKGYVVYSGPSNATARATMGVRISNDEGYTWPISRTVFQGPASYSDLVSLPGGDLGMIFENGEQSFADRVSFIRLPFEWLIHQETLVV